MISFQSERQRKIYNGITPLNLIWKQQNLFIETDENQSFNFFKLGIFSVVGHFLIFV